MAFPDVYLTPAPENPYGFCPVCGSPGVMRERCPHGNDRCNNGHVYPSRSALHEAIPSVSRVARRFQEATETSPVPGSMRAWYLESSKKNRQRTDLLLQLTVARVMAGAGRGRWPSVENALRWIEAGMNTTPETEYAAWEDRLRRASEDCRAAGWNKDEIMRAGGWR